MNRAREEIAAAAVGAAEISADRGRQGYRFNENFVGFAGHFPGYPILPAVLQVLMAQLLAERVVGEPLQFLSLERAKFSLQLLPQDCIEVSVCHKQRQDQLCFACELQVSGKSAASFTLVLSKGKSV